MLLCIYITTEYNCKYTKNAPHNTYYRLIIRLTVLLRTLIFVLTRMRIAIPPFCLGQEMIGEGTSQTIVFLAKELLRTEGLKGEQLIGAFLCIYTTIVRKWQVIFF